jgi:hypothetical protein
MFNKPGGGLYFADKFTDPKTILRDLNRTSVVECS